MEQPEFKSLRDAVEYEDKSQGFSLDEALAKRRSNEKFNVGAGIHNTLSGLSLGLSSLIASPFLTNEQKNAYLNYKIKHPILSSVQAGVGAVGGTLLTGGLGLAANAGRIGQIARGYETLQGLKPAKTFGEVGRAWAIGGATMATADMVDTASLNPEFLINNAGHYAGEILQSAIFGGALGLGTKALGRSYMNLVKGEKFFEESVIPKTTKEINKQANEFEDFFSPKLRNEEEFNKFFTTQQQGDHYSQNIMTMGQMMRDLEDQAIKISQGESPTTDNLLKLHFVAEIASTKNLPELIGSGRKDLLTLFKDWRRETQLQEKYKTYDLDPSSVNKANNVAISTDQQILGKSTTESFRRARSVTTQALELYENKYFESNPSNINLAEINGTIERISNSIKEIEKPSIDPKNPASQSPQYKKAIHNLALLRNEEPKLFNEIKSEFDVFKSSLVKEIPVYEPHAPYIKPKKIGVTYELLPNVTPRIVYDAMQKWRQTFNNRVADIMIKYKEQFVIDNPAVDKLWGNIKGELFNGMEKIFGTFGEIAATKSRLLDGIGNQERRIWLNLTKGNMRRLPEEPVARDNAIFEAYKNLSTIGKDAEIQFRPENVSGWMNSVKKETSDLFRQMYSALPNEQIRAEGSVLDKMLSNQIGLIDDMRITNDPFIKTLYKTKKPVEKVQRVGKGHGGLSIRNRVQLIIKDSAEGLVNPAINRYAYTNMIAILADATTMLGRRLLKMNDVANKTASEILFAKLKNISDLSIKRTKFMGSLKSLSDSILNFENFSKTISIARNQFVSFSSKIDQRKDIDEINKKFENISRNIETMRDDPSAYVERIDYALSSLRSVAPEVAEESARKIFEQIGLVSQILPTKPDDIYYEKNIPLVEKARFLDNFEALTNPNLMIEKMKYGTITAEQREIIQNSYPSVWEEILSRIRTDIYLSNPSQEARSRAYSMFGIQDNESLGKSQEIAKEMILQQIESQRPKRRMPKYPSMSTVRQPRQKALSLSSNLTPQGLSY